MIGKINKCVTSEIHAKGGRMEQRRDVGLCSGLYSSGVSGEPH